MDSFWRDQMMGDPKLIPLSDDLKAKADVVAVPSALLGYFQAIPWPELAAFLACIWTFLRIAEMLWGWWLKGRK